MKNDVEKIKLMRVFLLEVFFFANLRLQNWHRSRVVRSCKWMHVLLTGTGSRRPCIQLEHLFVFCCVCVWDRKAETGQQKLELGKGWPPPLSCSLLIVLDLETPCRMYVIWDSFLSCGSKVILTLVSLISKMSHVRCEVEKPWWQKIYIKSLWVSLNLPRDKS